MTSPGAALVGRLARLGWSVGTAESLTAGLCADAIAQVTGASAVFRGGVVAYAAELKVALLGVPAQLIAREGVVSEPVALAMASGAREVLGVELAAATTGVAGPGSADARAAGTVCIAAVGPRLAVARTWQLAGTRSAIRRASAGLAIALALSVADAEAETRRPGT